MALVRLCNGKAFEVATDKSLLDAATKATVLFPYSCKSGRCSACKCKVISGETGLLLPETGLTEVERADGWILGCARTAISDVVLDVEELGEVALPPVKTQPCRIDQLNKLAPDVLKVVLRLPPNVEFDFIPGQYIDVIAPNGIRRSYSLANAPNADKKLELHIRAVDGGVMSKYWFNEAVVNDLLCLHGPKGTFYMRDVSRRNLIFLATGTGMAPVKAILEALYNLPKDQHPRTVIVLWGGRQEHDLYFDVSTIPGHHHYWPVLSRASAKWRGERGYIQDALLRIRSDFDNCSIYACGSDAMIHSAKSILMAAGLSSSCFYSDAFVCSGTPEQ